MKRISSLMTLIVLLAVSLCFAAGCNGNDTTSGDTAELPYTTSGEDDTTAEDTSDITDDDTTADTSDITADDTTADTSDTTADTDEPPVTECTHSYETTTHAATCTQDGSKVMTCSSCGDTKTETVKASGHSYKDKQCTVCKSWQESEGLSFSMNADNASYSVSGIGSCKDTVIVIPDTYKNKPVTGITASAFKKRTSLKTVVIPETVTSLGEEAFYGCTSLTTFQVNESTEAVVQEIAVASFLSSRVSTVKGLTNTLELTLSKVEALDGYEYNGFEAAVFGDCTNLKIVVIPYGVRKIADRGFYNCKALTTVLIPRTVNNIGAGAFYGTGYYNNKANWDNGALYLDGWLLKCNDTLQGTYKIKEGTRGIAVAAFNDCSSLVTVTVPASLVSISECAFNSPSLTSIIVDGKNPVFKSIDGNVYSKDGKTFVQCAGGKTDFIIPNGVTKIGPYAFFDSSIEQITIPSSLKSVGDEAFMGCLSLSSVYITDLKAWCNIDFYSFTSNPCCPVGHAGFDPNHPTTADLYLNGEKLVDLVIPEGINSIRNYAFSGCASLKTVTIPDGVKSIGDGAFNLCLSLTKIAMPGSVKSIGNHAFYGCKSIAEYTIPHGVTSIGDMAFDGWSALTSITIPDTVKSIGGAAFRGTSLTQITIPNSVKSIGNSAFSGTPLIKIIIPDSVESIGESAFNHCTSLKEVILGSGLKFIGVGAFCDCDSLTSIVIPNSVQTIGVSAFYECDALTAINVPNSVTSIGDSAFYGCDSLMTVAIGSGVKSIGERAFSECPALVSITVDDNNPAYKSMDGDLYTKDGKTLIHSSPATMLTLPEGYTTIANNAFQHRTDLTYVVIPNSVTSIGDHAFAACTSLEYVNIPDSVTSIGRGAFSAPNGLTQIIIPDSVANVGAGVFFACESLTDVYCEAESQPEGWDSGWLAGCNNATVHWGYKGD